MAGTHETNAANGDVCEVCRNSLERQLTESWLSESFCESCRRRYPESLLKSTIDAFDYALGLRTGLQLRFERARIDGDWVHLILQNTDDLAHESGQPRRFDRGVDVQIDEITWCADAPDGS